MFFFMRNLYTPTTSPNHTKISKFDNQATRALRKITPTELDDGTYLFTSLFVA